MQGLVACSVCLTYNAGSSSCRGVLVACHSVLIVLAGQRKGHLCVPYLARRLCTGQV